MRVAFKEGLKVVCVCVDVWTKIIRLRQNVVQNTRDSLFP